ncbi:MAG: nucleotidyltransferase domain-containing protein [Chloroflexota bacterium]
MDLPKKFLARIVKKLDSPNIRGIALGGSYARGEAGIFSDVDILPLMRDDAEVPGKRFLLDKGKLVSVSPKTGASIRQQMSRPEKAIWVVPGVRSCKVLLDKDGGLGEVIEEARTFRWEKLQNSADRYAAEDLVLGVEVAFKVLSALQRDEAAVSYAGAKLLSWLTNIMAVQRGVLIETDHTYYEQVQRVVGVDSVWTSYHKIAAGISAGDNEIETPSLPLPVRALATLHLYRETVLLIEHILSAEQLDIAMQVVRYTVTSNPRTV